MSQGPILAVLAAGIGSRYGGIKQLDRIGPGGNTILEYSVYDAIRAGFGRVVFIIRRDIEADFCRYVVERLPSGVSVALAYQDIDALPVSVAIPAGRVKPWGTAHAVWCAREYLDGPFAVINADDFYGREAFETLAGALSGTWDRGQYCMVGYRLARTLSESGTVSRGVCDVDGEGYLRGIVERTKIARQGDQVVDMGGDGEPLVLDADSVVSMNCWGFTPDYVEHAEALMRRFFSDGSALEKAECYIPTVVSEALASGSAQCRVLRSDATWCGVTYPGDRPLVAGLLGRLVSEGVYPESLWCC